MNCREVAKDIFYGEADHRGVVRTRRSYFLVGKKMKGG